MKKQLIIGILIFVAILLIIFILLSPLNNKEAPPISNDPQENNEKDNNNQGDKIMENRKIKLSVNNHTLTATLEDNSSTRELVEKLKPESITIEMSDYANMEKVGDIGVSLPRNDQNITTSAGDLILYQGNNFVIYYGNNEWSLTRLGKIDNISKDELKTILGKGDVVVTISLN